MLAAHSMLLTELPDDISKLRKLTYLDISQNPIWTLPKGFAELKALETLKISGKFFIVIII